MTAQLLAGFSPIWRPTLAGETGPKQRHAADLGAQIASSLTFNHRLMTITEGELRAENRALGVVRPFPGPL
jgi:hypothetical protein